MEMMAYPKRTKKKKPDTGGEHADGEGEEDGSECSFGSDDDHDGLPFVPSETFTGPVRVHILYVMCACAYVDICIYI